MVRKIKAKIVLQLRAEGLSGRAIAASQGMSRKSITAVLEAADAAGVGWDDVADRSDGEVYGLLFPGRGEHESVFAQPDWDRVHKEMARVTLKLLHGEYADACAASGEPAMGYDRFCRTYQHHVLITGAASRVGHKAGQTVEVDWSGPTMQLTDPSTGKATTVYLFVGCLPFSRYAFVEPTLDMKQDSWLRAHVAMFEAFAGTVPRIVPDNLKTGVIKHPREGEIVLNDAYREMANGRALFGRGAAGPGETSEGQAQRGEHGGARGHLGTPTRSWTASCTTPSGSIPATTTCANTPP